MAGFDLSLDILPHLGPVIIPQWKFKGLGLAYVSSGWGVMVWLEQFQLCFWEVQEELFVSIVESSFGVVTVCQVDFLRVPVSVS